MLSILVVEDDEHLGAVLHDLLSETARVEVVRAPDRALERLRMTPFDVVLSDVDLGAAMNGLELLAEIAKQWPAMRRLAMSGRYRQTTEQLLLKPLSTDDLELIMQSTVVG